MRTKPQIFHSLFYILLYILLSTISLDCLAIQPYAGVNFKYSWVKPSNDWQRLFTTAHPGFAVYLGGRFHPNVGVELGYEWTDNKWTNTDVLNNGSLLGVTNTNGDAILAGRLRLTTAHVDLNAFIPIAWIGGIEPEGIVSIGVGSVKPWIEIKSLTGNTTFTNQFSQLTGKSKVVARFGLGLQTHIIECVGVRFLWRFETTHGIQCKNAPMILGKNREILNNTQALLAGVFFDF